MKSKTTVYSFIGIIIVSIICLFNMENKISNGDIFSVSYKLFDKYVTTTKKKTLFKFIDNKYVSAGFVSKGIALEVEYVDNNYYKVINISNVDDIYYIRGDNLISRVSMLQYDSRYKNYIVFNLNVVTNSETNLYDEAGNIVYSFNDSYSFPIIIKEDYRYGVYFDNRILYIKDDECEVVNANNTDLDNTSGIGVLNYHFFYDDDIYEERIDCNQDICVSISQFKTHLDYIKNNNYFTPTMKELEMYIDGKIRLPKSVLITIDDGWRADIGIKILTEYKLNATMFLVTSWADANSFRTDYVEVHSHSDNMHNIGDCPSGQGGGIQCLDEEFILNDLKVSSEKLGGSTVFCYPYYEYNSYSIEMLKKAGYTMAFAGEKAKSDNLVRVGSNKYELPRFVVVNYTSMNDFINYLDVTR